MSFNLVNLVTEQLSDRVVGQVSGLLNESSDTTQKAISGAVPAMLAGLMDRSTDKDGAAGILDSLNNLDDGLLDSMESALTEGKGADVMSQGNSMLSSIFGSGGTDNLIGTVSKFSGLGSSSSKSMLGLLSPIVMSVMKRNLMGSSGLSVASLSNLFSGQKDNIMSGMPSGLSDIMGASGFSALSGVKDSATALVDTAQASTNQAGNALKGAAVNTVDTAKDAVETTASAGGSMFKWLVPLAIVAAIAIFAFNFFGNRGSQIAETASNAAASAVEATQDAVGSAADAVGNAAEGAVSAAGEAVNTATDAVANVAEGAANVAEGAVNAAGNAVSDATEAASNVTEGVTNAVENAAATVGDTVEGATNAAGDALNTAQEAAENATESVQNAAGNATEAAGNAVNAATEAAGNTVEAASDAAQSAANAAQDAAAQAASAFAALSPDVQLNNVTETLSSALGTATSTLGDITDLESAQAALPQLNELTDQLSGLANVFPLLGDEGKAKIADLALEGSVNLQSAMNTVNNIPGVQGVLEPAAKKIMELLGSFTS